MSLSSRRVERGSEYGIIFDFDGTLALMSIDFDKMRQAIDALFVRYGIPHDSLNKEYVLERINEAIERVQRDNPALAKQINQEAFSILEEMELAAASKSHLLPGVYRRLWKLRERGFHLAIATRNCEKALGKIIGKARGFFEVILTRENSQAYKPEKAALKPILRQFSLPNDRVFMIGDHPLDVLTARRIPITPIAVMTGTGKKNDLIRAGAPYIFKHVNQAIDTLFGPRL